MMDSNDFEKYCEGLRSSTGNVSPSTDNLFSNREVLERRLKCRLGREDLIDRGIMPPHHASPNLAAQIHQLERAKTGDMLQKRIRGRASRQQLIQRHILADSRVDASLQEKQSALERHRIADQLNEQLFNRPGPLELIRENILEVEPKFADAIKHGCVPFHETCEDVATSPTSGTFCDSPPLEIDCGSSVDSLSPFATDSIDTFAQAFSEHVTVQNTSDKQMVMPTYQVTAKVDDHRSQESIGFGEYTARESNLKGDRTRDSCARKPSKSSKKNKQPTNKLKKKKYKYHEYKPPGSVPQTYQAPLDERYKRLLEQQQMFLQLQVMKQNALFAALNNNEEDICDVQTEVKSAQEEQVTTRSVSTTTAPTTSSSQQSKDLDDMRVIDLRTQLRQRGLPVSGSKAKLLERLKSYEDKKNADQEKKNAPIATISDSSLPSQENVASVSSTVAASSSSGTIMKVTTYATQNGQTFQVVQAIPNMQQDMKYQVIQEPIVLGQNALHATQVQGIQQTNPVSQSQAVQIGKVLFAQQNPQLYQNERIIDNQNQATPMQQVQYVRHMAVNTSEQLQFHIAPVTATTVGSNYLQNNLQNKDQNYPQNNLQNKHQNYLQNSLQSKNQSMNQNQQMSMTGLATNDLNFLSMQQVSQVNEQNKLNSASVNDGYLNNNPFVLQVDDTQNKQLNDSQTSQSALLLHLQQIRNSLNLDSNSQLQKDSIVNRPEQRHTVFRDRAHTDPIRTTNNINHSAYVHSNSSTSPIVMQQNGTVVVVSCDESNVKQEETKSFQLPCNVMENTHRKVDSQASEDLMEILGEISSSAHTSAGGNNFPSVNFRSPNLEAKENNTDKPHLFRIHTKQEPGQILPSCSKQRQNNPRSYGSLPGDLNMLGVNLHSADGISHSAHASCISLAKNQHDSLSRSMSATQNVTSSPMHMDDECMNMDIDEGVYLPAENELDWLNLNHVTHEQKPLDKFHNNRDLDVNLGVDSLDLSIPSANPYEHYGKSQDMMSIFDVDNSQPMMMAIDGNDSDKWGF